MGFALVRELRFPQEDKKRKEKTLFHSEKRDASERVPGRKAAAAAALQSCPTLCDPTDSSPPGSPVPGILQARTLEWVAISFSNPWKWKEKVKSLSHAWLFATPWTAAYQAPPSTGFSRQEYWSRCHCLLHMLLRFLHMSWVPLSCCFQDSIFFFGFQQFDYILCLGVNLYEFTLCGAFEHLGYVGEYFPSNLWNFQPLFLQVFFTCPFLTPLSLWLYWNIFWCPTGLWGFVRFSSPFFFSFSPDWISIHPSSSSQIPFWLFTFTV